MKSNHVKKYLLIAAGSLALALGIIGLIMPVLPTTPFLLITAFCYLKSSERLYNWLINHRVLGEYIYNYVTYRAVKKRTKIIALIFLWATLAISGYLMQNLHIRLFLAAVGIGVSIHLLCLKTFDPKKHKRPEVN